MGRNKEDLGLSPSSHERMDLYGRWAILEAKLGRREKAHQLIDQFIAEDQAADDRYIEDVRIAEVLSDQVVVNILDRDFQCLAVGELLQVMPQALGATPTLGWARVAVLYQELAKFAVKKCRAQGAELAKLRGQPKCAHGKNGAVV